MPKTVTLRLDDVSYDIIKNHAIADNRPLSNYIETATLKYIEEVDYVDDYEMANILNDERLIGSSGFSMDRDLIYHNKKVWKFCNSQSF